MLYGFKTLPAITKCCNSPLPPNHVIAILCFATYFLLKAGCQVLHDHVITIFNLLYQLPQKVNGEDGREACKLLLPAERNPPSLLGAGWMSCLLRGAECLGGMQKWSWNFVPAPRQKSFFPCIEGSWGAEMELKSFSRQLFQPAPRDEREPRGSQNLARGFQGPKSCLDFDRIFSSWVESPRVASLPWGTPRYLPGAPPT